MKLLVGEDSDFAGLAFPDDGGFVLAGGGDVAVETVVREIDFSADKPFGPGTIPFEHLVPFPEPVEFAGDARPEGVGVLDRFLVEPLVLGESLNVGVPAEFGGGLELALLLQNGIDVGGLHVRLRKNDGFVGHGVGPRRGGTGFVPPQSSGKSAEVYFTQGRGGCDWSHGPELSVRTHVRTGMVSAQDVPTQAKTGLEWGTRCRSGGPSIGFIDLRVCRT